MRSPVVFTVTIGVFSPILVTTTGTSSCSPVFIEIVVCPQGPFLSTDLVRPRERWETRRLGPRVEFTLE